MIVLPIVELLANAAIGVVFLAIYITRSRVRISYGLRHRDKRVREVGWNLAIFTGVIVAESTGFVLMAFRALPMAIGVFSIIFGITTLAMGHRLYLLLREGGPRMPGWLKADAKNRAARTAAQAVVAVLILPAADAILQVLQRALVASMAGTPFDWAQVGATALTSAAMGVTMAALAYLHRLKLDPSAIPSLPPPAAAPTIEPAATPPQP